MNEDKSETEETYSTEADDNSKLSESESKHTEYRSKKGVFLSTAVSVKKN